MTATEYWMGIFGRRGEVEVEIGPGTGTFLCHEAKRRYEVNFLAIENSRGRAARLAMLIEHQGLRNVRVVHAPAQCVVRNLIPQASVAAYHIYFPDPWWKRRHHKRRLFTPEFGRDLVRTVAPGGRVYVATDVSHVWNGVCESLVDYGGLTLTKLAAPPRPVRTAFEQKGLSRGVRIWEGTFVRRDGSEQGLQPLPPLPSLTSSTPNEDQPLRAHPRL